MAICRRPLSKKVLAWRIGKGLRELGWEWRGQGGSGDIGTPGVEVIQQALGLAERGKQSLVGAAAAQLSLSPVNPRKLYVLWQRLLWSCSISLAGRRNCSSRLSQRAWN